MPTVCVSSYVDETRKLSSFSDLGFVVGAFVPVFVKKTTLSGQCDPKYSCVLLNIHSAKQ